MPQRVTLTSIISIILLFAVAEASAEEPKAITDAESVIAVYREDWLLADGPAVILVAWPDGNVVFSSKRVEGGAPYRGGRVDPKKVTDLLTWFDKDGLFADEMLNRAHLGPDSPFITVYVKSGNKKVKMKSWHELFETSGNMVANHRGAGPLEGRRRLDELRKAPAEYLFFRMVWSET